MAWASPATHPRSRVKFSPRSLVAGAGPDGCHSKLLSSWALGPLPWDLGISLAADMVLEALHSWFCVYSAQAQLLSRRGCTARDPWPWGRGADPAGCG